MTKLKETEMTVKEKTKVDLTSILIALMLIFITIGIFVFGHYLGLMDGFSMGIVMECT